MYGRPETSEQATLVGPAGRKERAMSTIHQLKDSAFLSGLIPVCAACGKTRDAYGQWQQFEPLPCGTDEEAITHTICPTCLKALYPKYVMLKARQSKPD